jgi:hypothetical protein
MDNKKSSNISKINELKKFLKYLYIEALLKFSPNEYDYDSIINKYLNNKVTIIQPPLQPPVTTIKKEDSREYSEKYGPPFVLTEEQERLFDERLKRWKNDESQPSNPRTQVTKEHIEQAKAFDQNNNLEITFLKKEISKNYSNLETLKKTLPKDVTFTNKLLLYNGNDEARRSLIENFNKLYKYQSVSESESEKLNSISNNAKYLLELNHLLNILKEPSDTYKSGGKPAKYKSTGITVFILYKNKKYNRTIYVKDTGKTKYCKIKNEYILLSKLKVI